MSELKPLEERIKNLTIGLLGMADGETIQVNKSFLEHVRADMVELSKLRRAQPENKPLTLNELREMGGEPVYIDDWFQDFHGWELSNDAEDYFDERDAAQYGSQWVAYRYKPEEATNER